MADTLIDETNIQLKGAIMLFDQLFWIHLRNNTTNIHHIQDKDESSKFISPLYSFLVQCGQPDSQYHSASYMASSHRGFRPLKDLIYFDEQEGMYKHLHSHLAHLNLEDEDIDAMIFDVAQGIQSYKQPAYESNPKAQEILSRIYMNMNMIQDRVE